MRKTHKRCVTHPNQCLFTRVKTSTRVFITAEGAPEQRTCDNRKTRLSHSSFTFDRRKPKKSFLVHIATVLLLLI